MNWDQRYRFLAGLALTAPIPFIARAEVYFTETQAADLFFPGVKMTGNVIDLAKEEAKALEKASRDRFVTRQVKVWTGPRGETMYVDRVLGKHEFITYAVAINPDGKVKGVEIMDYRETYGYQVRDASWRAHFVGKSIQDPVKLEKDIPNISGATLSSVHVTNGVFRMLKTHEYLRTKT